jgi:farnesyl diphosphate synthase
MTILQQLNDYQAHVNHQLEQALTDIQAITPERLYQALCHATLAGGKRLRPALVYLVGQMLGSPLSHLDIPAVAVELIHCYSLVHDDLPAMDDDPLRRGRPTCHIAFDEATAILAGDALQSLAFELLATPAAHYTPSQQLSMTGLLAKASGATGMVGGQMLDLQAEQVQITLPELHHIHRLKTGELLTASIQLGALAANCQDRVLFDRLTQIGENIGIAFQIQDDLLDVTQSTEILGKTQGADQAANKTTYLSFMSIEQAQQTMAQLINEAKALLEQLPYATNDVQCFIDYLIHRHY